MYSHDGVDVLITQRSTSGPFIGLGLQDVAENTVAVCGPRAVFGRQVLGSGRMVAPLSTIP